MAKFALLGSLLLVGLLLSACVFGRAPNGSGDVIGNKSVRSSGTAGSPTPSARAIGQPPLTTNTPTQQVSPYAAPTSMTTEAILRKRPIVLVGHNGPVTVLAWSPDAKILASSSGVVTRNETFDPTVRLWSAKGKLLTTLRGHTAPVTSLEWSPDGQLLASGSRDGTVRLWDAHGKQIKSLRLDEEQVYSLAWSPDGQILAVGSIQQEQAGSTGLIQFKGVVRLFGVDGRLLKMLITDGGGGKWLHVEWSSDGSTLAAGAWGFRLWQRDGKLVGTIGRLGAPATVMIWSPDGSMLATGNEDGLVSLYDHRGRVAAQLPGNGPIVSLAFSPDGGKLALMSGNYVRMFDLRDPHAEPRTLYRYLGPLAEWSASNIVWSPDGVWLAGRTPDSVLRVWRANGRRVVTLPGCNNEASVLAWSPDGKVIAAGGSHGDTICLWIWPTMSIAGPLWASGSQNQMGGHR
ncbi:WD40 repeat domain-containing protein [Thermobaculum terrenum]|uniref:WD40 repeat domain-containing protein n=1 Tax=Thermobaculum terrenum TaxID=166501 RepID=UPI00019BECF1|nr:WD40 repeat domain-containing protein [Thermobaculum terrenum]